MNSSEDYGTSSEPGGEMARELLRSAFRVAVAAVEPFHSVEQCLRLGATSVSVLRDGSESPVELPLDSSSSPLYLVALGKASAAMAAAAEKVLSTRMTGGIAIMPDAHCEHAANLRSRIFAAAHHNLPDARSMEATSEVLALIDSSPSDASFVFLISGGGSALFSLPAEGVTLEEKLATIRTLVGAGASIQQLNAVRSALSAVKGGRVATRLGERKAVALVLSDIVVDPLEYIASGPLYNGDSSLSAAGVIDEVGVRASLPDAVVTAIDSMSSPPPSTPVPHVIVCSNARALRAMQERLAEEGYEAVIVSSRVTGDALAYGRLLADLVSSPTPETLQEKARQAWEKYNGTAPADDDIQFTTRKIALLFGGETTLQLPPSPGVGGRSQAAALAALLQFLQSEQAPGPRDYSVLIAGTDGQDGPTDAAGVIFQLEDVTSAGDVVESATDHLERADSFNFWKDFQGGRTHLRDGLTGTNVMDVAAVLLEF